MKLYLLRHGQSVANQVGGRLQNLMPDPDLTDLGQKQVELTAEFLRKHAYRSALFDEKPQQLEPRAIYSSPARRALKTAAVIGKTFDLSVGIDVCLHEVGGAVSTCESTIWGGLPRVDALRMAGDSYCVRDYPVLGWWFRGEENKDDAWYRVSVWLNWLQSKHGQEDVVIVVGHGALFDHVAAVAFGHSKQITWMSMYNAGIARIDCEQGVWKLVFWNQHVHLKDVLSY